MINFEDGKAYEKPCVYLAGGMEHAEADGAGWRVEFTPWLERLGYEVFNPVIGQEESTGMASQEIKDLRYTDIKAYQDVIRIIIEDDLTRISKCAAVVCLLDASVRKGAGTYGELTHCFTHGIPVYALIDLPNGITDLPGWCIGCITDFEESKPKFRRMMDDNYDAVNVLVNKKNKRNEEAKKLIT